MKYITMLFRGSDHRKERVVYFNMVALSKCNGHTPLLGWTVTILKCIKRSTCVEERSSVN